MRYLIRSCHLPHHPHLPLSHKRSGVALTTVTARRGWPIREMDGMRWDAMGCDGMGWCRGRRGEGEGEGTSARGGGDGPKRGVACRVVACRVVSCRVVSRRGVAWQHCASERRFAWWVDAWRCGGRRALVPSSSPPLLPPPHLVRQSLQVVHARRTEAGPKKLSACSVTTAGASCHGQWRPPSPPPSAVTATAPAAPAAPVAPAASAAVARSCSRTAAMVTCGAGGNSAAWKARAAGWVGLGGGGDGGGGGNGGGGA